ncbi:hypothetical protein C7C56_026575 [Massilia glaciei]|uniref:Uncharacterized protein n=1 Tax=Massilia glaciei TaxID=1524097 RepID=A0A2U2H9Y7_9BURK|nr:hypothetical protein C7C56_026575 [Massilia glaciei]
MLITLDPVGMGGMIQTAPDIYPKMPAPLLNFVLTFVQFRKLVIISTPLQTSANVGLLAAAHVSTTKSISITRRKIVFYPT